MQRLIEKIKQILLDSPYGRGVVLIIIALTIIAAGFLISIYITKDEDDAGRGGALVVALSFYFVIRQNRIANRADGVGSRDGSQYIIHLLHSENNIFLALMSVIGTLAWGFLDIPAGYLICH